MVDEERVREALAEVKEESDMHLPMFLGSFLAGGSGIAVVAAARRDITRQVGLGLTGFGTGLGLAEASAMVHNLLISERGGERTFPFHHDAVGVLSTVAGAAAIASEDVPDEIGSFLVGLGAGLTLHHYLSELCLTFSDKSLEQMADEFL